MKTNFRGKIREFVQSEEGKVGVKSPLALGVATGSILLAQAIIGTTPALACISDDDCHRADENCHGAVWFCPEDGGACYWIQGSCY